MPRDLEGTDGVMTIDLLLHDNHYEYLAPAAVRAAEPHWELLRVPPTDDGARCMHG